MSITFESSLSINEDVLVNELNGESVFLNLANESYYGLDDVGTIIWHWLTQSATIQAAYDVLLDEFDVEPEQLRQDLEALVAELADQGLICIHEPQLV